MKNFVFLSLLLPSIAFGVEAVDLQLKGDGSNVGAVKITRSAGNMVFEDLHTTPTSLQDLLTNATDHGALDGLEHDDHPHYLNEDRHEALHDAAFNNGLAITGAVGEAQTIGEHVGAANFHLGRDVDETITGSWTFEESIGAAGGAVRLGPGQFDGVALQFEDGTEDAELVYTSGAFAFNRPVALNDLTVNSELNGGGTANLTGFAEIDGLPITELLSGARNESISEPWTFLSDVTVEGAVQTNRIRFDGIPTVVLEAKNTGAGAIAKGDAVMWNGMDGGRLHVARLGIAYGNESAFAGIAMEAAAADELLEVGVFGAVEINATGTFFVGTEVAWDGSTAVAGDVGLGWALEDSTGTGLMWIWIGNAEPF